MKRISLTQNQKGFSLIEVIVSMAMLAIIVVPLLSYFVSSTQYNARQKNKQNATFLAQSIIEECKDKTLTDIARSFHITDDTKMEKGFTIVDSASIGGHTSNIQEVYGDHTPITDATKDSYDEATDKFVNSTDGKLYYAIYNIQRDGNKYDALITMDTNLTAGNYTTINNQPRTDVYTLNAPKNIAAVESSQNSLALNQMMSLNADACRQMNDAHQGEEGYVQKIPEDSSTVLNALNRIMVIDLEADAGVTEHTGKAKIYYKYYCHNNTTGTDILGCASTSSTAIQVDPPLYNESVNLDKLEGIYLFYTQLNSVDQVELYVKDVIPARIKPFNLYLLCQAQNSASNDLPPNSKLNITTKTSNYTQVVKHLYSNISMGSLSLDGVTQGFDSNYVNQSVSPRMINLQVDVYKAADIHFLPENLSITLKTTKKE